MLTEIASELWTQTFETLKLKNYINAFGNLKDQLKQKRKSFNSAWVHILVQYSPRWSNGH